MKKPDYIEIRFPGHKSTFSSAKQKYFKRLEDRVLELNFARNRERKIFEYKVLSSSFIEPYSYWGSKPKPYWSLRLGLKVPEQDPNKVL